MTAYRSADAPPDAPYVNPLLERALLEHYRQEHRRVSLPLVGVAVFVVLGVLVFPSPIGLIGGSFVVVAAFSGIVVLRKRPRHLLDRIRTGIPIRRVQRESQAIGVRFADGSWAMLASDGHLRQLARIEHLLTVQMKEGGAPRQASAR